MRSVLLAAASAAVLTLSAYLAGGPEPATARVRLKPVNAATAADVDGIARVFPQGKDEPLRLPGLFDRLRGLTPSKGARGWHVVPAKGAVVTLPRARLRVEALSCLVYLG